MGSDVQELRIECALDEQYAELYNLAMKIAAAYLAHANWVIENNHDRKLRAHMLISVRIKTQGCWVAIWSKKLTVKDSEKGIASADKLRRGYAVKPGQVITKDLPRGPRTTYPASTFNALPTELRSIAIHYERLLGDIRKAAHDNRLQKRAITYSLESARKVITECAGVLAAGEALRSEGFSASLESVMPIKDGAFS